MIRAVCPLILVALVILARSGRRPALVGAASGLLALSAALIVLAGAL